MQIKRSTSVNRPEIDSHVSSVKTKMEGLIQRVVEEYSLPDLKPEQFDSIMHLVNKRHCLTVLPTGYGKSMCFYLPPLVQNLIDSSQNHASLVISPLRSLVLSHLDSLRAKGIRCVCLTGFKEEERTDVLRCNFDVIFSSPEVLISDFGRKLVSSEPYQRKICVIAFDEAHCLTEWGDDFRPTYGKVSILRSLLTKVPVSILTATITNDMMTSILSKLMLKQQAVEVVAKIPDRSNIMLKVSRPTNVKEELDWYVEVLAKSGRDAPKAIIYCRSLNTSAEIYEYILYHVGSSAWLSESRDPTRRLIDMYHSACLPQDQERITREFCKTDSTIRCVVATIAFGMGVNVPDVRYIFHVGPSKSALQYWQEIGRCGRDGGKSTAYLFITPRSLDSRRLDSSMLSVCTSTKCLRLGILEKLIIPGMDLSPLKYLRLRRRCTLQCQNCACELCQCCSRCKDSCGCDGSI